MVIETPCAITTPHVPPIYPGKKLQADNETVKFQLVIREIFLEKKGTLKFIISLPPRVEVCYE